MRHVSPIDMECFAFSALEIICYKKKACVINSSEKSGFLRFYVYLCLMSDILYLGFSSTGISEFSDMGKYWIIYCCPITCSLVKI